MFDCDMIIVMVVNQVSDNILKSVEIRNSLKGHVIL